MNSYPVFRPFTTERPLSNMQSSDMNAYICVYRHPILDLDHRPSLKLAAASNPILHQYLSMYNNPNCYYDFGDDPSFFAASEILGDVCKTTWGVCQRKVRKDLKDQDYVVFFCAKQVDEHVWDYFYIGVGTASLGLSREIIWSDEQYAKYRNFFNILARLSNGVLEPYEVISSHHGDWEERCQAPYWLFDPEQSQFNLVNPLHVATYIETEGPFEIWRSSQDGQVARLKALLFPSSAHRLHLRTTNSQPHKHITLLKQLRQPGQRTDLDALRVDLIELAKPHH
jgi:hypothetical protein